MKNRIVCAAILVLALGCMKKQADGTYRVTEPSDADKAKARENAVKAGEDLKKDTKELGEKIKAGAEAVKDSDTVKGIKSDAKRAGEKIKSHTK